VVLRRSVEAMKAGKRKLARLTERQLLAKVAYLDGELATLQAWRDTVAMTLEARIAERKRTTIVRTIERAEYRRCQRIDCECRNGLGHGPYVYAFNVYADGHRVRRYLGRASARKVRR
jgi:hypothetical protein